MGVSEGEPCELGLGLEFDGLTGIGNCGIEGWALVGLDGVGEVSLASRDEGAEMDVGGGGGMCLNDGGAVLYSALVLCHL